MLVRVLLFSQMRQKAGTEAISLDLPEGTRLGEAIEAFYSARPDLREFAPSCLTAVGLEYAQPDHPLAVGDEISLIPPVSGG